VTDQSLHATARGILRSKRKIAILFTDMCASTELWEKKGDVHARMLVDRHNRLIFPIVKRHRGKVLKTIGDSVMASFRRAVDALEAAIAIQQALAALREEDPDFPIHVKVGAHCGLALVEHGDVYGDAVNVAARIQERASQDQIFVSSAVVRGLDRKRYGLVRASDIRPRGRRRPVGLYAVDWGRVTLDTPSAPPQELFPVYGPQRNELLLCALLIALGTISLFQNYLRFILADFERTALLFSYSRVALDAPMHVWIAGTALLVGAIAVLARMRRMPRTLLRLLYGGAGFTLAGALFWLLSQYTPGVVSDPDWERPLWESQHLFVQILQDDVAIRSAPSFEAPELLSVGSGALFLLSDVDQSGPLTWNRVWLGGGQRGFVPRVLPAELGRPRRRVSLADKFYFRVRDLATMAVGGVGFLIGFWRFRLRPI